MALIVEDGTGLSTAESYASVATCDAYHAIRGAPSAWTASTTGDKEVALRKATEHLEQTYASRWRGTRTKLAQALAWPRVSAYDDDGYLFSALPTVLVNATCELALRYQQATGELVPDLTESGVIQSESVKVGPIEESKVYAGGRVQGPSYPFVDRMVARLISSGRIAERG